MKVLFISLVVLHAIFYMYIYIWLGVFLFNDMVSVW